MGCFSVPACPNAEAQAQIPRKTVKTSLRIAGCKVTEGEARRKGKRASVTALRFEEKPGDLLV